MEKSCRICGERKPFTEFHRATAAKDGHRSECKACFRELSRARYRADPQAAVRRVRRWQNENRDKYLETLRVRRQRPEVKAREREGHLRRKFRISQAEYDHLLAAQGGGCAICGKGPPAGKALHVDHDHRTGLVRALLCFSCNAALGQLKEDPDRIQELLRYLDRHDPEQVELATMARERLVGLRS